MTVVACMLFALAISALVAPGAWLLERGLSYVRVPTRWVWLGALGVCVGLPLGALFSGQGGAPSAFVAEAPDGRLAPVPTGIGERSAVGSGSGIDAIIDLLASWRRVLDRALASGIERLPVGGSFDAWLGGAWSLASLLLAFVLLASMLRLRRRARALPAEILLGRHVRVSRELGPATVGLLRPEIVVPCWAKRLEPHELELVLAHESEHVRSSDPLLLVVGLLPAIACPWNPLVWWQVRRLRDAVEVDCDRRVLGRGAPALRYGDLLVKLGSRAPAGPHTTPTMSGSASLLERRLTAMRTLRLGNAVPRALAATALGLGLLIVACTTEPPAGTEAERASEAGDESAVVAIRVQEDGSVYVNGVLQPVERLSGVLSPLRAGSEGDLVVSIEGHRSAPYRVVSELQRQLQAAGLTRVVFSATASDALRAPPRDVSTLVDAGLPLVLPAEGEGLQLGTRNLLHLEVRPSGLVEVRRGGGRDVREVRPQEVAGLWREEVALNPDLVAVVSPHPEGAYSFTLEVLSALRDADARRISLRSVEE